MLIECPHCGGHGYIDDGQDAPPGPRTLIHDRLPMDTLTHHISGHVTTEYRYRCSCGQTGLWMETIERALFEHDHHVLDLAG